MAFLSNMTILHHGYFLSIANIVMRVNIYIFYAFSTKLVYLYSLAPLRVLPEQCIFTHGKFQKWCPTFYMKHIIETSFIP
jgi:hypothetical protein